MNPVRSEYRLPFLNEISTKLNELNSNRDKQPSTSSMPRFHPDGFVNQIDQLEQTANSCDNPQRGALRQLFLKVCIEKKKNFGWIVEKLVFGE